MSFSALATRLMPYHAMIYGRGEEVLERYIEHRTGVLFKHTIEGLFEANCKAGQRIIGNGL